MSSWFDTGGLSGALNSFTEQAAKAAESVKSSIPTIDTEKVTSVINNLALNSDEMKAERQMFGDEAKHKAQVRDMLAGMLPWETKDPERDILVEECKEAILKLSSTEETFYGPYEMPGLAVKIEKEKKIDGETDDEDDDEEEEEQETSATSKKERKPSEESLEKLAKLEPLPPLLKDFDLDSHVGLIKRLLQEDPQLSHMQSTISGTSSVSQYQGCGFSFLHSISDQFCFFFEFEGGGAREKVFWHNYFFHCAFTRYEAGLSIDEIWSFQPDKVETDAVDETAEASTSADEQGEVDETVVFSSDNAGADGSNTGGSEPSSALPVFDNSMEAAVAESNNPIVTGSGGDEGAGASPSTVSLTNEFEMVGEDDDNVGSGDPELDELEAEIARELED